MGRGGSVSAQSQEQRGSPHRGWVWGQRYPCDWRVREACGWPAGPVPHKETGWAAAESASAGAWGTAQEDSD